MPIKNRPVFLNISSRSFGRYIRCSISIFHPPSKIIYVGFEQTNKIKNNGRLSQKLYLILYATYDKSIYVSDNHYCLRCFEDERPGLGIVLSRSAKMNIIAARPTTLESKSSAFITVIESPAE